MHHKPDMTVEFCVICGGQYENVLTPSGRYYLLHTNPINNLWHRPRTQLFWGIRSKHNPQKLWATFRDEESARVFFARCMDFQENWEVFKMERD